MGENATRFRLRVPAVKLPAEGVALVRQTVTFALGWLLFWRRPRPRKWEVMKPYTNLDAVWRRFALVLTPVGLFVFCLIYGFFFALTAPYLIVPFAAPIAVLMLMAVWALPERTSAPTKTMELFFSAFIVCLVLWPNYLALALPGLPWITALRLTGFPMTLLFLVSLSTSRNFRGEMRDLATAVPGLWIWFLAFIVMQVLTLGFAKSIPGAMQKTLIQQVNWTVVAAVAAWVCRIPGRPERYLKLIMLTSAPMLALGMLEFYEKHVLWVGYVPSFLKIDDPIAALVFSSVVRSATGIYRSKAVFGTPLGLAEFFALLTPFAIHFIVERYRLSWRVGCFIMLPLLFYGVRLTDARLGVLGFLVSIMLYLLIWGMRRFRRNRRDLLAATVVYAYPATFVLAAVLVKFVKPINVLVFGNGAQAASNLARQNQIRMAIPKIVVNPIGHGSGGSGGAIGYARGDFVAIDNYYIDIGLNYGVVGLVTYLGIFLITIAWALRSALATTGSKDREITLLIPLAVALSAFLVIKLVFAQADLHPLIFAYLGMTIALIQRARADAQQRLAALEARPATRRVKSRFRIGRRDEPTTDDGNADDFEPAAARRPGMIY